MDVCRPLVSDSHVIQTQGPRLASSVFDMTLATWYGYLRTLFVVFVTTAYAKLGPGVGSRYSSDLIIDGLIKLEPGHALKQLCL